jgi:hypothetical protein
VERLDRAATATEPAAADGQPMSEPPALLSAVRVRPFAANVPPLRK